MKLSSNQLQKKVELANKTYQNFLTQLEVLQEKQNKIILEFVKKLEEKKLAEIRKKIGI